MRKLLWTLSFMVLWGMPALAEDAQDAGSPWESLQYFVGRWAGTGSGMGGNSTLTHEYRFVLQENFLHMSTDAVFPPQEGNPEGELHADWGMFSYDAERDKLVLRQFLSEGYVNQYVLEEQADDPKTLVLTSESSENAPAEFGARLIFRIIDEDHYEATLQLAPPGKDWFDCRHMDMSRQP